MPIAVARPSSRYRAVIIFSLLAVMLLGFFALGRLSLDLPPSSDVPRVSLQFAAPGLIAPVIEEKLTARLESVLADVSGVAAVESVTATGRASIDLRLDHRRNIDMVQREARARLERAKTFWPVSIDLPSIAVTDASSKVAGFTLTSRTRDALALRDWVEAEFAKQLRELSGVATVGIEGGAVREILVMPDQRRLAGYGLSFEDLLRAIRENPEVTARVRQLPVKGRSRRESIQSGDVSAVAAVPVLLPGGESIRLSEVARLALSHEISPVPARLDDAEAVKVIVNKHSQAALSDVVDRVRSHVDWMRANRLIPDGIEISGHFDEVRRPLGKMAYAFLVGFILVLSAVHLLWGSGRRTLIFGAITVASLQGVFVAMALSGATLDVITLAGLVLGTGLFGGSVTLMFEETTRSAQAPVNSANPVMAAAVAIVAALAPVWFIAGELSMFYREFVAVFAGAWLLAALLSWWLVPMFDTRGRRGKARWNAVVSRAVARMRQSYDGLLHRLLQRAVLALVVAALALGALVTMLFSKIGEFTAQDGRPGPEVVLRIQGADTAGLTQLADDMTRRLGSLPALRQVSHSAQASREELMLRMNEERARELGVDIAVAGKALAMATTGIPAGSFRDADHRYNVRLRLPPEESHSVASGKILLLGELENRPAVHLRDVATLERVEVPAQLRRYNGKSVIEITALMAEAAPPDLVMNRINNDVLSKMRLPSGVQMFFGRQGEAVQENRMRGLLALGAAVFLIFIGEALLYRSLRMALQIILMAGATLIGTGSLLLWSGLNLSPAMWLGALLLFGISAGHATVLATPGGALRPPEMVLSSGIRQASRHMFRPLFAMTLTGILGMASLMWINGGVAVLHPLIITLATGLVISLLVNLLLAPLLYGWLRARN